MVAWISGQVRYESVTVCIQHPLALSRRRAETKVDNPLSACYTLYIDLSRSLTEMVRYITCAFVFSGHQLLAASISLPSGESRLFLKWDSFVHLHLVSCNRIVTISQPIGMLVGGIIKLLNLITSLSHNSVVGYACGF